MSKFKSGIKVVRIVEWSCTVKGWQGKPIQKGQILTIRSIENDKGNLCLRFEEIKNPLNHAGREFGYLASEFEPIIESNTGFIEMTYTKIIESIPMGQS